MTDESSAAGQETESQQRRRLHDTARELLLDRQSSNSESYDKAILTLSSAFLGLSLTFIKEILPAGPVIAACLLYLSWVAFAAAIVITLASFRVSDAALTQRLGLNEDYYLKGIESAADRTGLAVAVDWLNNIAGGLFILGVVLTVAFVMANFSEANHMSNKQSGSGPTGTERGHTVPPVQKVVIEPLEKGQPVPQVQKVTPQTPANQNQPAQAPAPVPKK